MTKHSVQASLSFAPAAVAAVGSMRVMPEMGVCCGSPKNKGFIRFHQTMRS
jgi:hypothetical protein